MAKQTKKTEKPTLPPQEALYQAISLCRKAGALTMGFDAVEDASSRTFFAEMFRSFAKSLTLYFTVIRSYPPHF